jgi:4,5-dihydroxyphthalate decarboxylase
MAKLRLTLACTSATARGPSSDGRVQVPGVEFIALPGEPEDIFRRALRDRAFEVSELSMGSHITTTAPRRRRLCRRARLPVARVPPLGDPCPHRSRHRAAGGPCAAHRRSAGVPATAALWVRGILRERHGVDTRAIRWRIGAERIAISLPTGFDVAPLGMDPEAALREGLVDALITPRPPAPHPHIARLFPEYPAAEKAYFAATGFFPIMHCLAVRRDVADAHPWLPVALFRAFAEARRMAVAELRLTNVLRVSLPWVAAALEEQERAMGGDIWPYGFARNRDEIAAMARYAQEDGLAGRLVPPEELFHPSTLAESA